MRFHFTAHLQMFLGPVLMGDEVLASFLLLGRYLLPPPLPPPFLHQQSARALQHLVSPHDLRQTPWHKSVRTLVARPFRISLILFQTSYIAVT